MAWTTPKTWSSEPLTSLDLNTYVRDNQIYLRERLENSADTLVSADAVLSTTSTEFVDVDADKFALTLTTSGGDVLVGFTGTAQNRNRAGSIYFNLSVDNVDYVADDGITRETAPTGDRHGPMSFVILVRGLSAGSHTFKLRWKVSSGNTCRLDVVDLHPQFWVKEI